MILLEFNYEERVIYVKFLSTIIILISIVSSCFFNRSASIISDKYRVPKKDLIYLGEVSNYEIWKRDTISSDACTEDIVMPVVLNRELQISGRGGSNCYTGVFAFKDGNAYMLSGPDYKVNGRTSINELGISIEELCSIKGACKRRDFSEYPIEYMVGGRPREEKDNKLLIPDKLSNYGHIWVEINDETYIPDDFPKTERWRYYLEFVIKDLDKSSYPWKATAIRAYYPAIIGENYNIIGPIVEADESHILVSSLYQPGLTSVGIGSNTKYAPGVSSDFKVGNLVNITYNILLETFPGQTTAEKVFMNEKHFVPEIINNYFDGNGVYIGMYQNPMYYNASNSYDLDYEETFGNYTMIGGSFSDYVLLVDDKVITLTDAIENELIIHCEYLRLPNLIVISD
ncbi:hypothetical protein RI065_08265 [Mycoplasmatota bacterium zrk1]